MAEYLLQRKNLSWAVYTLLSKIHRLGGELHFSCVTHVIAILSFSLLVNEHDFTG